MNKCDRYCEVSGTPMMIGSHSVIQEAIYASLRRPATDQSEHVIMSPCGTVTGPCHRAPVSSRRLGLAIPVNHRILNVRCDSLSAPYYGSLSHSILISIYMRHKNTEIASHKCRLLNKIRMSPDSTSDLTFSSKILSNRHILTLKIC